MAASDRLSLRVMPLLQLTFQFAIKQAYLVVPTFCVVLCCAKRSRLKISVSLSSLRFFAVKKLELYFLTRVAEAVVPFVELCLCVDAFLG